MSLAPSPQRSSQVVLCAPWRGTSRLSWGHVGMRTVIAWPLNTPCNVHVLASPRLLDVPTAHACKAGGVQPTCRQVWHGPCSTQTNRVVNPMTMQLMATQGLNRSPAAAGTCSAA